MATFNLKPLWKKVTGTLSNLFRKKQPVETDSSHETIMASFRAAIQAIEDIALYQSQKNARQHFQPEEAGMNDGPEGIPADDSAEDTAHFDKEVLRGYSAKMSEVRMVTHDFFTLLMAKIFNRPDPSRFGELTGAARASLDDQFEARFMQKRDELQEAFLKAKKKLTYLKRFRVRGNLTDRDAKPLQMTFLLFLVACMIGESFLNAWFYQDMTAFGYTGGILQAIVVSVANVVPCFLFGLAYRYKNATCEGRLTVMKGIAALLAYLAWFPLVNVLATIVRFADEHSLLRDIPGIIMNLRPSEQMEALCFFMIGAGISFFAFYKGYCGLLDKYPGYSRVTKEYDEAKAHYRALKQGFQALLKAALDEQLALIDREVGSARETFALIQTRKNTYDAICEEALRNWELLLTSCASVLEAYRVANVKTRVYVPDTLKTLPTDRLTAQMQTSQEDEEKIEAYMAQSYENYVELEHLRQQFVSHAEQRMEEFNSQWKALYQDLDLNKDLTLELLGGQEEPSAFHAKEAAEMVAGEIKATVA